MVPYRLSFMPCGGRGRKLRLQSRFEPRPPITHVLQQMNEPRIASKSLERRVVLREERVVDEPFVDGYL